MRQRRLDTFREKTAQLVERTVELGARASVRVTFAAKDAGRRVSVSAREASSRISIRASRRFSISRKSIIDDKPKDFIERSSSTHDGSSGNRKFDEEPDKVFDENVRKPTNEGINETSNLAGTKIDENADEKAAEAAVTKSSKKPKKPVKVLRPSKEPSWDPTTATWRRLHGAIIDERWDEAFWCINKGADIRKWKGILGETTLHDACMRRAPSRVVKALVAAGADVNSATMTGLSPLHAAVMYNPSATVIEVLIKAGSRINQQSKNGNTPLIAATAQGRAPEIIALLLRYGANPRLKTSNGKSAVEIAKDERVIRLLQNCLALFAFAHMKVQPLPEKCLNKLRAMLY